jgi:hypothetical protein
MINQQTGFAQHQIAAAVVAELSFAVPNKLSLQAGAFAFSAVAYLF